MPQRKTTLTSPMMMWDIQEAASATKISNRETIGRSRSLRTRREARTTAMMMNRTSRRRRVKEMISNLRRTPALLMPQARPTCLRTTSTTSQHTAAATVASTTPAASSSARASSATNGSAMARVIHKEGRAREDPSASSMDLTLCGTWSRATTRSWWCTQSRR